MWLSKYHKINSYINLIKSFKTLFNTNFFSGTCFMVNYSKMYIYYFSLFHEKLTYNVFYIHFIFLANYNKNIGYCRWNGSYHTICP